MSYTVFLLLLAVLVIVFVIAPIVASLIGFVHAIKDSVRRKSIPNIILIVCFALALFFGVLFAYGSLRYSLSGGTEMICIFNTVWARIRLFLMISAAVCGIGSVGVYVFMSFRPEIQESEEHVHHSREVQNDDEKDLEKNNQKKIESAQSRVKLYRGLTIAVGCILLLLVITYAVLISSVLGEHDIQEYTSPDGKYTIVVDNIAQTNILRPDLGVAYEGRVYLRTSLLFVRQLEEEEGRVKYLDDINPDEIEWMEDGVQIPFGNTYLIFYYDNEVTE